MSLSYVPPSGTIPAARVEQEMPSNTKGKLHCSDKRFIELPAAKSLQNLLNGIFFNSSWNVNHRRLSHYSPGAPQKSNEARRKIKYVDIIINARSSFIDRLRCRLKCIRTDSNTKRCRDSRLPKIFIRLSK